MVHRLLKLMDMFSIVLWHFYHELMNNNLSERFSPKQVKPPDVNKHYEMQNPLFHLPDVKHKFTENYLQYYLIKHINEELCISMGLRSDTMQNTSFYSFHVLQSF